jgi:hypothetical protein
MFSRILTLGTMAAMIVAASADLTACGDKFLRPGRSARFNNFQSLYPSSILIVRPPNATAKGLATFQTLLKNAGHTSRVVTGDALLAAVATGAADLVIAEYGQAIEVERSLQNAGARQGVLPVLSKPTATLVAAARSHFPAVIRQGMEPREALGEIDKLLRSRQAVP